jgi:hypothetical protein
MVGLDGTGQGFYNLQQDVTWFGGFQSGMGLVYNGAGFGNTPTGIVVTFDGGNYGAGAYIQTDWAGLFTATETLYDSSFQVIGTYTTTGISNYNDPGTTLFIGMLDSNPEVFAAEFWATSNQTGYPSFAIGTLGIRTTPYAPGIPEPVTFLLLGPALVGMGMLKRRLAHR